MAKDKTKDFIYAATVTVNGKSHKLHFRKDKQRAEFISRIIHLQGVSHASIEVGLYVYDDVEAAVNTVANYADRMVTA